MCGIAGFIQAPERVTEPQEANRLLQKMCDVIRHRGPDEEGLTLIGRAALGMRRLSIIDLVGGHQPMSGEDGQVTIVFNGEIYNFLELHELLESKGHTFKTRSDTEAIVHAFEEFGSDCLEMLRGMFAFAIWDARSQELFLARDRVGKKPLYYTLTEHGAFVFGSELKSLLLHPEVHRELDTHALDAYFTLGYVPDPLTIFTGINKLPPGHYLRFREGRVETKQYWDFSFEQDEPRREEDYLEELQALLDEAVRVRLIADVPLGAFLSGGIDSSTIVGLMSRHMDQPVKTFSIGFHEDSYNELQFARLTAERFGTEHHEFFVTPDICDIADELVRHFDEPFADSSAIPTYMVSKLAREFVTVVLTGDGGDEVFGGYTRYLVERKRRMFAHVPGFLRKHVMRPISRTLPHGALGRNFIHNVALDPVDRYLDSISVFTGLNRNLLYSNDLKHSLSANGNVTTQFRRFGEAVKTSEDIDKLLYIDSKTYLPGDILTKVDRVSMAVSLEARAPLLDHKLIEFMSKAPANLKLAGYETKYLLKKAVSGLIPSEILTRPKQGFGLPVDQWINKQLRGRIRETLTQSQVRQRGYLDPAYVAVLLDEHERGRRDHSMAVWALFMFELWYREYMD
jgi:asparagine synthase (glutamine-hydrolysing)